VQILVVVANIQVKLLEGRRRRRVPCQHQMDTGKSVLRDGGNLLTKSRPEHVSGPPALNKRGRPGIKIGQVLAPYRKGTRSIFLNQDVDAALLPRLPGSLRLPGPIPVTSRGGRGRRRRPVGGVAKGRLVSR